MTNNNTTPKRYRLKQDWAGEKWLPVVGFEGLYEVSSIGRVRSLLNGTGTIIKQFINKKGYCCITPSKNGKVYSRRIHRLMAEAFLPNPNNYPIVRHLNDVPNDNRLENLSWGTSLENGADAKKNKRYKSFKKGAEHHLYGRIGFESTKGVPVIQKDLTGVEVARFGSVRNAHMLTKVERNGIAKCCKGEQNTAGGFIWEFASIPLFTQADLDKARREGFKVGQLLNQYPDFANFKYRTYEEYINSIK